MSVENFVFFPERFMASRRADRLRPAGGIVLATGLAYALTSMLVFAVALGEVSASLVVWGGVGVSTLLGFLVPVVLWTLLAWLFVFIGTLFDAWGEFREVLVYTGWAFVPNLCASLLNLVVVIVALDGMDPVDSLTGLRSFVAVLRSQDLVALVGEVSFVFAFWTAGLWVFAVKEALDVDLRTALYIVVGPGAVWLGLLALDVL